MAGVLSAAPADGSGTIVADPAVGWVEFRRASVGIRIHKDRTACIVTEQDGTWVPSNSREYRLPASESLLDHDAVLAFALAAMGELRAEVSTVLTARKTEFIHLFLKTWLSTCASAESAGKR